MAASEGGERLDDSDLALRQSQLSEAKRALLQQRLRGKPQQTVALPTIPRRSEGGPAPLSFAQERLWFIDQLIPRSPAFNIPSALRLDGPLDVAALRRSLNHLAQRHETLRTIFRAIDGRPFTVVAASAPPLQVLDLAQLPQDVRDATAEQVAFAEARRPFDLAARPLLRAYLLRLGEQRHRMFVTLHHIISDEWSIAIFVRELIAFYRAEIAGVRAILPELPIQYADYALWQRERMQGERLDAELAYWTAQVAGAPSLIELPADHPRSPIQSFHGANINFSLPRPLSDGVMALTRKAETTLFMTLLAALEIVLYRYSGQAHMIVGTGTGNRTRRETEGLIGCLVNILLLRGDLSGDPSFTELLARVRETCLAAYAHQELPFEKLIEAIQPQRDLSYQPFGQTMFVVLNAPTEPLEFEGLRLEPVPVETTAAQYELLLHIWESADGLGGRLRYRADMFELATIHRLVGHLQTVLEACVTDPAQHISTLSLLTAAEREQILVEWNGLGDREQGTGDRGQGIGDREQGTGNRGQESEAWGVHQLFEAQAERTPDAVAVVFDEGDRGQGTGESRGGSRAARTEWYEPRTMNDEDSIQGSRFNVQGSDFVLRPSSFVQHLTYAELNARAERLADRLRVRGVGPESIVGVCLPRSAELLVGLLGVLKAGGAYLPLDPSYPPERRAFMREDAHVTLVIYDLRLDDLRFESADAIVNRKSKIVNPSNLAYVIYTSGSTGQPKGVQISHRSAAALLKPARPLFQHGPEDVWTVVHSYAFDYSVWELWAPLLNGGRLLVVPLETTQTPSALYELICRERVTVLHLTPSELRQLLPVKAAAPAGADRVRLLVVGGEPFPAELLAETLAWAGAVLNVYGPTEATVFATSHAFAAEDAQRSAISVGRPIANRQVYVLDAQLNPVPIGVAGELYVGGVGLARGYLDRPDLTAERFVPNSFNNLRLTIDDLRLSADTNPIINRKSKIQNITSTRLYKTGDLARWLADGTLALQGRIDGQVKLRGHRIELGEIEAVLAQHVAVREAVALVREDRPGDQRLVAYIVTSEGTGDRGQGTGDREQGTGNRGQGTGDRRSRAGQQSDLLSVSSRDFADSSSVLPPSSLVTELRDHLKQSLPSYMVPSAFVLLDELPLTPNGKVDWRALPVSEPEGQAGDYVAPSTPAEELLAGIWATVLGSERVGAEDNFFALGGHSLLATQMISRVRQTFAVELPLRALFGTPTVRGLAAQLQQAQQASDSLPLPPLRPQPRGTLVPLSFAQERLWFIDQFTPGIPIYNIPLLMELRGQLDLVALRRAINAIVRRHEALRTTFANQAGTPVQQIAPPAPLALSLLDLDGLPPAIKPVAARQTARAEAQRPFDLGRGPLVRVVLVYLSPTEHLLVVTLHHIIADGWSLGVLVRELAALYPSYREQAPARLPPLPVQYADYTLWQREWLAGELLAAQLGYWQRQLAEPRATLDLSLAGARPSVQSFAGATARLTVDAALSARLHTLSRRAGTTLFMTLLAGFNVLLYRYSGQDDLLVGTPIANRTRPELEGLIGFFVNTLVLRSDLRGDPSGLALLERVREVCLQAYAHQDVPFERLVEELQPERDLSRTPLFQVMLVLQNAPLGPLVLPGLELRPVEAETGTARFDLLVSLMESGAGLEVACEYNTDLFRPDAIAQLLRHYAVLLDGLAVAPERRIDEFALLTAAEREQIVYEWNELGDRGQGTGDREQGTGDRREEAGDSRGGSRAALGGEDGRLASRPYMLHELVAAQVDRTPDAIAIVFDEGDRGQGTGNRRALSDEPGTLNDERRRTRDESAPFVLRPSSFVAQLTYRELNDRANALAQRLRARGVGPDVRVGLCLERSAELLIGMLGILKAGGAYVPLDPSYPPERIAFMLEDSQAAFAIYDLRLDDLRFESADAIVNRKSKVVNPDNLAYVIYTSGSTGRPKGVAMPHGALANLLEWQRRAFALRQPARTAQYTSISFDVSFQEIVSTWSTGGTLVLVADEVRRDPRLLLEFLSAQSVERLFLPFVALQQLAEAVAAQGAPAPLREVITAGEQLRVTPAIASWLQDGGARWLHNHYGPSETHVVTAFTLPAGAEAWPALPPIGRPIANTQIYLLNRAMQPVPPGVPGELYIGGVQLARGYLDQPDLTAERFVPNPFSERLETRDLRLGKGTAPLVPSLKPLASRLYRTGDLARYQPDGTIEFLGRTDQQVKLHGYRVEPGEIEAVLEQHPDVREAVVIVREERLVAYVVEGTGDREQGTDDKVTRWQGDKEDFAHLVTKSPGHLVTSLRSFLADRLPDYMIPSAFVLLDALPLTPSGKLDRMALPAPEGGRADLATPFVAPRTEVEALLARIWGELLGRERVGVADNFFALGGHSLLATRVVARIRQMLGVELSVRQLFEHPTIAALAQQIATCAAGAGSLPPLVAAPRDAPAPIAFAQESFWLFARRLPRAPFFNMPAALRLTGTLDRVALARSLSTILRRHEALRTTFPAIDDCPAQIATPARPFIPTLLDLRDLPELVRETVAAYLVAVEAFRPFDLQRGPLLRLTLVQLDDDEQFALMTLHHIAGDGWSIGLLAREVEALYAGFIAGQPATLPALPVQYADFATWQRRWLHGAALESRLERALGRIDMRVPPAILPMDRPPPPAPTFATAQETLTLSRELTDALAALGHAASASRFMVLVAGFSALLYLASGQERPRLATLVANRSRAEVEWLIGLFINTLLLQPDLSGDPSFRELLDRIRATALDAFADAELPFELLLQRLEEQEVDRDQIFHILFLWEEIADAPIRLPGLVAQLLADNTSLAQPDVTLTSCDLIVVFGEAPEGIVGRITYKTALFDAATVEGWIEALRSLLSSVAADPSLRLSALQTMAP